MSLPYEKMTRPQLLRVIEQMGSAAMPSAALVDHLLTLQDQTRLQAEQLMELRGELEASRDRYSELYEFAPIAMVTLNRSGIVVGGNSTALELLGITLRNLIDRPM